MTPVDVAAIRARLDAAVPPTWQRGGMAADLEALLAEVERLRQENAEMRRVLGRVDEVGDPASHREHP